MAERRVIDVDLKLECPKCGVQFDLELEGRVRYDDDYDVVDVWCPLCKVHVETFTPRDAKVE